MALVIILVIKKIIPTLGIFLPKNKTPPRNKVSTQRETQPATRTQQVPHLAEGWRDTGPHENAIFRGWLCRGGLFQMPTLWGIYYITRTHQCPPPPGPAQTLFAWVEPGRGVSRPARRGVGTCHPKPWRRLIYHPKPWRRMIYHP